MKLVTFRPLHPEPAPPGGVLVTEWTVGRRRCRMVQDIFAVLGVAGVLRCEWTPDLPRKLTKREWRQYRAGRAQHWQRLANTLGGGVLLVDP